MSRSAITRKLAPSTEAMFDALCDGRWHPRSEIVEIGAAATVEKDRKKAVAKGKSLRKGKRLTSADFARIGAASIASNNLMIATRNRRVTIDSARTKVRMYAPVAREWRRRRSQELAAAGQTTASKPRQFFGEEQTFGGWLEFDAWALAPLATRDIAYVRPNTDFDVSDLRAAFPDWEVRVDPDGLVSVSAPVGDPVKEHITQWLADNEIYHEGVRDAHGVSRRNIRDLPQEFLNALVEFYTRYALNRVRERHAGSLQRLVGSHEDIAGEVGLWVMECIADFNPEHGVPFGAWLTRRIKNQVMDLNRASFGRTAADAEMRRARAIEAFETENGRMPTREELRLALGYSEDEMRRKERDLAHLRGLRSSNPLEYGPDETELPVRDIAADPEGETLNLEMGQAVSRALLAATGHWDSSQGKPVAERTEGFLITYLTYWDEWTKGDLVDVSNKTNRTLNDQVRQIEVLMEESLNHLRSDRVGKPRPTGEVAVA